MFESLATRETSRGRYSKGYIVGIEKSLEKHIRIFVSTEEIVHIVFRNNELQFQIVFAYIPPSSNTKLSSLFSILDKSISNSLVIGDLNARIGNFQTQAIIGHTTRNSEDATVNPRGRDLIKCIEDSDFIILNGLANSDPKGNFTFCSTNGSSTIDLSLCSSEMFSLVDFRVLEELESHHFPIMTKIEGKRFTQSEQHIQKIAWDVSKSDKFSKALDEILTHVNSKLDISLFSDSLIQAANQIDIVSTRRLGTQLFEYGPKWFDKSCLDKKKYTKKLLREIRKADLTQKHSCKLAYLTSSRYYRSYIRAKRLKFFGTVDNKLCDSKNPKEFYAALAYYRPKNVSYGSKEHVTPTKFQSFYSELFCNEGPECDNVINLSNLNEGLDKDFDFHELSVAINSLSKKKAAGPDTIVNEMWICLSDSHRLMLLDCINECWRSNNLPSSWSEIIISPIYKKGPKNDPSNYRPISLVNTCLKLLTSLMTGRLNTWCEENKKVSEFQAAYKKGTGCEDHVFTLSAILQNHLKNKKNVMYALFIDLTKAFDSVNHNKLWKKLHVLGLSSKFILMIQTIYKNAKAKVRTPYGESIYFPIEKGVLQGECLSAKLFTLFIDDIINILHESDIPSLKIASKEIHMLMYADDIVVLATNVFDLQRKIDVISEFFKENDLSVNLSKTKVVMFKYGRVRKVRPKVFWGNDEIEFVNEYTYLGVPFYSNLSTAPVCNYFLKRAKGAENQLFNLFYRSKMKTMLSRTKLYDCLVKSMLTYCCSIWGIDNIEKLEIFQNNFLRRL
jgi:hypothetical protein